MRSLGYDAIHLNEQKLARLPDPDILEKARSEMRILLTYDLYFSELVAASGARLPSVVVFRLRKMHPQNVNHYLLKIIRQHQTVLEQGVIISVTEIQNRVRTLPVMN